jgi:hypothetical protein
MSVDAHGNVHTPAGVTTGGQFTGKAKAEADVSLAAPVPVPLPGQVAFTYAPSDLGPLPDWPEAIARPSVDWEVDDDRLETTFTFPTGSVVTCWSSHGDDYNTLRDVGSDGDAVERDVFGGDRYSEDAEMAAEWMTAVHHRIDTEEYGLRLQATQSAGVHDAVVAAALYEGVAKQ